MKNKPVQFSEEDIQRTIRYLKTKDPKTATRENAIKMLEGMKVTAHMIAHDIVDKGKSEK